MKLLSLSSGRSACGIADYNRHLANALGALMTCDTIKLSTKRASRDQVRELVALRRYFAGLARTANRYDVVLLQYYAPLWNGGRPIENMLPIYLRKARRPQIMVLHEWPSVPGLRGHQGNLASRAVKRAMTLAWLWRDVHSLDYERWMTRDMFQAMDRIIVHAPELRDQLVAAGVDSQRISVERFPLHELPAPAWRPDEVLDRFGLRGKRTLAMLGHPIARKGFDLAVRALAQLPEEVVILLVSAQADDFARQCVADLRAVARDHGVEHRLIVSDFLTDAELAAVFGVASLAVSPFRSVTGSSSLAHFFAAGLPVVASDLAAIRVTRDAGAGVELFRAGDVDDLARVIGQLLAEPERLAALRARDRDYATATSFAALARRIKAIADEVLH